MNFLSSFFSTPTYTPSSAAMSLTPGSVSNYTSGASYLQPGTVQDFTAGASALNPGSFNTSAPDYSGITASFQDQASQANALALQQYAWAQDAYAKNKGVTDAFTNNALQVGSDNLGSSEVDRAFYNSVTQPMMAQQAQDAANYASPGNMDRMRGRAVADVNLAFEAERQNHMRDLESYGINPGSVRFAGLDAATRTAQAAAAAGAANQSDLATENTARALQQQSIQNGMVLPGQAVGESNAGIQAGTAGVNANLATTASGANTMGTAPSYLGFVPTNLTGAVNAQNTGFNNAVTGFNTNLGAYDTTMKDTLGAYNSGVGAYNTVYDNGLASYNANTAAYSAVNNADLNAFKANQSASSGFGSALGLAGGLGMAYLSGGMKLPGSGGGAGGTTTTNNYYAASGGEIPMNASPSGGQNTDDVPARLTPGEFVMPKDVVSWYGEEKMQSLINKARESMKGPRAKPQTVPMRALG